MKDDDLRDRTDGDGHDDARSWVVRLASGKLTAEEGRAFRQWHAADPAHARAFVEAKRNWTVLGQATHELSREAAELSEKPAPYRGRITRRAALAGGAAAAAAAVAIIAVRPPFGLWSPVLDLTADYHTGIGETRTIAMTDNVSVQLSTRSRLSLQSDGADGVRLALLGGEAAIASTARAVTVVAGAGEARTESGRFNLRNDDQTVRVTCLEGHVDVRCAGQQATLGVGQQIRYGVSSMSSITSADAEEITAWQRGVLVFRNRTLGYVVDEVNRYRAGKIILTSRALGNQPVTLASFHLDRLDEIVPQLETLYGARARRLPGGIVLLS